jgi:P-type E1-E2 ATPase
MVGRLGFRDALRPDSADVVRRLREMSIRVALLSGDNIQVAVPWRLINCPGTR